MNEGWAADPTGRHQERFHRDGGWTSTVRDRGVVNEDPIPGVTEAPRTSAPAAPLVPTGTADPSPLVSGVPVVERTTAEGVRVAPPSPVPPSAPTPSAPPSSSAGPGIGHHLRVGASLVARVIVSVLWAAVGAAAAASGAWGVVAVVAVYLAYLWLFGGRWLIY